MWIWIVAVLIAGFILVAWWNARSRNERLDAWARSVSLSKGEQDAMWEIWQAFKAETIPTRDPLTTLDDHEREHIKLVCSPEFRPTEFGSANTLRLAQFMSLVEKGYEPAHAAVIVGMTINRVGRKDI